MPPYNCARMQKRFFLSQVRNGGAEFAPCFRNSRESRNGSFAAALAIDYENDHLPQDVQVTSGWYTK